MSAGIHHVTSITRRAQANVDFYSGFLGLHLVKRTAGFEDVAQLHLFYGDPIGSPGSLVTFLVWEDGAVGRAGIGQPIELALAINPESIGFWLTRCLLFDIRHRMPSREFGEPVLRLTDPDGITIKLVGSEARSVVVPWKQSGVPPEHAVRRVRGAVILSDQPHLTIAFLKRYFGYRSFGTEDTSHRLVSDSDTIDVRRGVGFWPGVLGAGTIDHIAIRAPDIATVAIARQDLVTAGATVTDLKDRRYFSSIYVREPAGALLELATETPGMTVDEPVESLGTNLFVPPGEAEHADDIRVILPQIALPGEKRDIHSDLPFVHRLYRPDGPDGSALVLLHGTGGSEADLMPLGRRIAPRATLLGVRGRSTEEGLLRWFRRVSPTQFDQADIRAEAEAFAFFVPEALRAYDLDPARTTFLGYSNGANFIAAFMLLHPHVVRRAALLRPVLVLEVPPSPDLTDAAVLSVAGQSDPYGSYAATLESSLRSYGARVDARWVAAGHELVPEDTAIVLSWVNR
jgi:phospholipase/carboxylesterase